MFVRAAFAALLALGVVSGGACTLPFIGPDAGQLLSDSQKAFDSAQSYHEKGTFKQGPESFNVDLTVVLGSGLQGSGTVDGVPFELIRANGKTYIRGRQLFEKVDAKAAKVVGDQWVLSTSQAGAAEMDRAINPNQFSSLFGRRSGIRLDGEQKVNGVDSYRLSDASGTMFVARQDPHYPVRGVTKPGYVVDGKASDMTLDIDSYNVAAAIQAPTKFLDFNDPKTLPARFSAQDLVFDNCNAQGCGGHVTVTNEAGAGSGTMLFHLLRSDGSEIGSCSSAIPELGYKQSVQVGCRFTGRTWTDYVNTGALAYRGRAEVPNPLYD